MTGTLHHLDPTTLQIGENVRDNAALDSQSLASVREHGALQPITAIRADAGIEVRDGQWLGTVLDRTATTVLWWAL